MAEGRLRDRRILVVEEEYMLADELRGQLEDADAVVLGPVGTLTDALAVIRAEPHIDGAILDANLHGEMTFPAADLLAVRGVPFVFTTGYDASMIPERFSAVVRCEKPVSMTRVAQALSRAIHA